MPTRGDGFADDQIAAASATLGAVARHPMTRLFGVALRDVTAPDDADETEQLRTDIDTLLAGMSIDDACAVIADFDADGAEVQYCAVNELRQKILGLLREIILMRIEDRGTGGSITGRWN